MKNNDDFSPETIDEQIDRLAQSQPSQNLNATLTHQLKAMCEEDRTTLERVRVRYTAHLNAQPSFDVLPSSRRNEGTFSVDSPQPRERPVRQSRRVFALAAVLLVAVFLMGSALWIVKSLQQPEKGNTHPGQTPQSSQTHTPTWTPTATSVTPAVAPSGRSYPPLVYDDAMNALLLFSGQDYTGSAPLTDTWIWNGSTWTRLHPAHQPGPRTDAAIAYDPTTQQIVLYGGLSTAGNTPTLSDTWTWNGSDWTQQHPASSPPARLFSSLAYDDGSGQLVLFGGEAPGMNSRGTALNDTWIWTGSNWQQQHPATVPPARAKASLAYDDGSGQLVLFGGDADTSGVVALNDTWIWTGSNWQQQQPRTSPATSATLQGQAVTFDSPGMVYNPTTGKLMLTLIGQGANNDGAQTDYWTQADWTWTGNNWIEENATGPAVQSSQIFYDEHLHTVFELTTFLPRTSVTIENKLWKWTGQTWIVVENW